ncbi:hypothetical protein DIGNKC_263 [Bacillus phage DIGNKC]|uniref:hypothetical protein n=1 Tax=Bacillus phage DIGNKC TaxID=1805948 RepID=UPI0007A770B7|nr:hypothetical protein BI007_gp111 [Bacillus phage DIGNKC]AMW62784.1 hypothetical protein DIGNKC_263 [Bacillus phage DIGNKC]
MKLTANKHTLEEWVTLLYTGDVTPYDIEATSLNSIYVGCIRERFKDEDRGVNKLDYCPKLTRAINLLESHIINQLS